MGITGAAKAYGAVKMGVKMALKMALNMATPRLQGSTSPLKTIRTRGSPTRRGGVGLPNSSKWLRIGPKWVKMGQNG